MKALNKTNRSQELWKGNDSSFFLFLVEFFRCITHAFKAVKILIDLLERGWIFSTDELTVSGEKKIALNDVGTLMIFFNASIKHF